MNGAIDFTAIRLAEIEKRSPSGPTNKSVEKGGGGGDNGGMDDLAHRVGTLEKGFERIEKSVEKLDDRLRSVETTLSEIKGTLNTLSGTLTSKLMGPWQLVGVFAGMLTAFVTLSGLVLAAAKWLGILHISPT